MASALFEHDEIDAALATVDGIKSLSGQSERDKLSLLRARLYDHVARQDEALAIYQDIVTRMPGEEARCRYAALLIDMGRKCDALGVLEEVEDRRKQLDGHQRRADADMYHWAGAKLKELRG